LLSAASRFSVHILLRARRKNRLFLRGFGSLVSFARSLPRPSLPPLFSTMASIRVIVLCSLLLAAAVFAEEEWVRTPNGDRPRSCVHGLDSELEYAVHHRDGSLSSASPLALACLCGAVRLLNPARPFSWSSSHAIEA